MNDLTGMYDASQDLDSRILAACQTLEKVAADEGIDLGSMSQEDLQDLIAQQVDSEGDAAEGDAGSYEGGDEGGDEGGKEASGVTDLDVFMELQKRAAYEGIDLASLTRDQYADCFVKVAQELTDPDYAEEQQKLAAQYALMDELGRTAARSFVDEVNKVAADEPKKDDDEDNEEEEVDVKIKKAALSDKLRAGAAAMRSAAGRAGRQIGAKERQLHETLGRATTKHKGKNWQEHISRGRKITAGAGAAGAGAYAGKKVHDHSKKASYVEAAATELARQMLLDSGIDPDTGTKLAGDDEVEARAYEILRQHGYAA